MNDLIKIESGDAVQMQEATQRAEIDMQITTARAYPRDLMRATNNAIAIATMDKETASSCGYALPRAGKNISGASVHLARIIAAEYGNLRIEAKVVNITATQVVSQAICFDLEKNYAVKIEVRRSIVGKHGLFSGDMITVTGNAANAISYRNAVFAVVPKSIVDKVFRATRELIAGDLSDDVKLLNKRMQVINGFKDSYGVSEGELLNVLGLNTINQIKSDEIIILIDLAQAIKDGDTTVEEAFERKTAKEEAAANNNKKMVSKIKNKMKKPSSEDEDYQKELENQLELERQAEQSKTK